MHVKKHLDWLVTSRASSCLLFANIDVFLRHIKIPWGMTNKIAWNFVKNTSSPKCTYCVLSDDIGGVSVCLFLCFPGGAEHLKQLLYSILQQPVDQSLQQRQLRKKVLLTRSNWDTVTNSISLKMYTIRTHPYAVCFKHHFNVLNRKKNTLFKRGK